MAQLGHTFHMHPAGKCSNCFHSLGHPGVERIRQAITEKVVWPSMRSDIGKWAKECIACQRAKVTRHTVPPIGNFEVPNKRFDHVNIDLVTLPVSNGFKYLLTIVDRFTRWPVAVPIVDSTTQSVVDAFAFGWVQNFGVPHTVTSDRGAQFLSSIFQQLASIWGIRTITTTPYHPEANGLVERFHRRLKESIIALGADNPEDWFWKLPMVMLSIRTTLKPDVGASPADLVYGEGLAVPGEALPANPATDAQLLCQRAAALADMRLEVARLQPVQTSAHRRPLVHLPEDLETCSHVFVRRGGIKSTLASPYIGPYRVVSRNSVNFIVAIAGRQNETVAICRVKPAYSSIDDAEAARPPPPRPPGRPPRRPRAPRHDAVRNEDQPDDEQLQQPQQRRQPPDAPHQIQRRNRRRSRRLPSEDDVLLTQQHPQAPQEPVDEPLTFDFPHDDVPEWTPPAWFDVDANPDADPDADPEPEAEAPPAPEPPPPPPPPRAPAPRKRKPGNPNWVKGNWSRRRPDVSALMTFMHEHLGIPNDSPTPDASHMCTSRCESLNSSS